MTSICMLLTTQDTTTSLVKLTWPCNYSYSELSYVSAKPYRSSVDWQCIVQGAICLGPWQLRQYIACNNATDIELQACLTMSCIRLVYIHVTHVFTVECFSCISLTLTSCYVSMGRALEAYGSQFMCMCVCVCVCVCVFHSATQISSSSRQTKCWYMQYRHNATISQSWRSPILIYKALFSIYSMICLPWHPLQEI